jgi:multidrug resistance efflux pump
MKTNQTEWERFNDFAQKVISVPKKEIDRRQAEWQKQRKALKKAKA